MDSRKTKRVKENKEITLIDDNRHFPAVLTSISKNGMSVRCSRVFPTYKEIGISFNIGNQQIEIRGCVRWVNEHVGRSKEKLKEIGILVKDPPAEFLNYVNAISK
jgi:Tfp pilus assembly protein PilZ